MKRLSMFAAGGAESDSNLNSGRMSSRNSSHGSRTQTKGRKGGLDEVSPPNYRESPIDVIESPNEKDNFFMHAATSDDLLVDQKVDIELKNMYIVKLIKGSKILSKVFETYEEKGGARHHKQLLDKLIAENSPMRKLHRDDAAALHFTPAHFMIKNFQCPPELYLHALFEYNHFSSLSVCVNPPLYSYSYKRCSTSMVQSSQMILLH